MTDFLIQEHPLRLGEKRTPEQDGYVSVRLPDLFALFLSGDPVVNPYYEVVRAESEAWMAELVFRNTAI